MLSLIFSFVVLSYTMSDYKKTKCSLIYFHFKDGF